MLVEVELRVGNHRNKMPVIKENIEYPSQGQLDLLSTSKVVQQMNRSDNVETTVQLQVGCLVERSAAS